MRGHSGMAVQPGSAELNHARPVPIMSAMAKPLVDRLVPNELWALVEPLLPLPPRHGRRRSCPTATALPRWCSRPVPPPPGSCCPPQSSAVAAPPPPGDGWTSGNAPASSTSSPCCCWIGSARPAASTWPHQRRLGQPARSKGRTRRNPVDPRQAWQQAAPERRQRRGRPAGSAADGPTCSTGSCWRAWSMTCP